LPKASDLATPDYMGHTLLHYATESRRVDTIDLLLNAGYGDIHLKDLKGRTLMQHAASRGNIYAVQRLIELGADNSYNISNKNGRTTIQVANEFIAKECLDIESSIKEVKEDIIKSKKEGYLPHSVTVGRAVFTSLLLILTWWFIY
jgi:ankyrin repeat protein